MHDTFESKWRNAAFGIGLTAVVFAAGWAIAFW
jgi:hypothetical protein